MRLKPDLQLLHVGHDYFVVDPSGEPIDLTSLYVMNEATAWLWQELQGQDFTADTMVERLCAAYDVAPDRARTDIQQLISSWTSFGLLL